MMPHVSGSLSRLAAWLVLATISSPQVCRAASLTADQRLTAEQITSIFENSTPDFQYGYIEDIGDGSGVTCGRIGFTGDELQVIVGRYVALKLRASAGTPALAQFLPCLEESGDAIMKDYSCLFPSVLAPVLASQAFKVEGGIISQADFGKDWVAAAQDPLMRQVQDDYVDSNYFRPALELSDQAGLHTPLGIAFVYDAVVQMDADTLVARIAKRFAGSHEGETVPAGLSDETDWLWLYIDERKKELSVSPIGASTTGRVDSLAQILKSGNLDLHRPLSFDYDGQHFDLP